MAHYVLQATFSKGNGHRWQILGLPGEQSHPEEPWRTVPCPDTTLWLVGMHHSCDTAESIMVAVYSTLYDELQTNERLKNGDTFESQACTVNKYHSYDAKMGQIDVPAMRFRVDGVHVVRLS